MKQSLSRSMGVFLCDCAPKPLAKAAGEYPVFRHPNLCGEKGRAFVAQTIRTRRLERIVLAGCSRLTESAWLAELSAKARCATGSMMALDVRDKPLPRATEALRRAIASLMRVPPLGIRRVPALRRALVVGGGPAGRAVAEALVQQGCRTTVVESQAPPAAPPAGVEWLAESRLCGLDGFVGGFSARLETLEGPRTADCGAVILATGGRVDEGVVEKTYGSPRIVSLFQLLAAVEAYPPRERPGRVALVLDVNREESVAEMDAALKTGLALRRADPSCEVVLCCREARVAADGLERRYNEARSEGIVMFKYTGELVLKDEGPSIRLVATDAVLNEEVEWTCHVAGVSPYGLDTTSEHRLADALGIELDAAGNLQANNPRLFPGATNRPGVYVVGASRGQRHGPWIQRDARATASAVAALLARRSLEVELSHAAVDPALCIRCLTCIRLCPHKAMYLGSAGVAEAAPEACQRCGICASACPARAITLPACADPVLFCRAGLDGDMAP